MVFGVCKKILDTDISHLYIYTDIYTCIYIYTNIFIYNKKKNKKKKKNHDINCHPLVN